MDPLCEKYYSVSPYAYCENNPIMLTDPNGMDWLLVTGDKVYWYGGDLGDTNDENTLILNTKLMEEQNDEKKLINNNYNIKHLHIYFRAITNRQLGYQSCAER